MSSRIASEGRHLDERRLSVNGVAIFIVKLPDDSVCIRASLGGDPVEGYYLTYRGDEAAVTHLLETLVEAWRVGVRRG